MSNIYDLVVFAWREHKRMHGSKSPKQFELAQDAFNALTDARKAILSAGKYSLPAGWEATFYGTPVLVIDGSECFVVDYTGQRSQLGGSSLFNEAGSQSRRMTDA